jgi:Tol biopolymer transport system component
MINRLARTRTLTLVIMTLVIVISAAHAVAAPPAQVEHDERWGIYALDLETQQADLLFSSPQSITTLRLNHVGDTFVFSSKVGGDDNEYEEIFTLGIDGGDLRQITDNTTWDLYPAWSPDDTQIAFLSWRDSDLDIYVMDADGSHPALLYDSGTHDADVHWGGDHIVFTAFSQIWIMDGDGTNAHPLTDPPRAGEWGNANLPFGDYDPRISPDGSQVVFERLVDDQSPHGNYDLFRVDIDGTDLTRLTDTGYSQGLASWSHVGDRLVYVVAAMGEVGKYDLFLINADGTGNQDITPDNFPPHFLCHSAVFSLDDTLIYFVGEWWPLE